MSEAMGVFFGIGAMAISLVIAWGGYQIARLYRMLADTEENYTTLELSLLHRIAAKKGIDIDKEMIKRNYIRDKNRSFRKKIESEIFDEMFGDKKAK